MTDDERCRHPDCIYRNQAKEGVWAHSCDYLRITGKSRIKGLPDRRQLPCNCPHYIPDGTSPVEILTRNKEDEALALYNAGATDREIEEALGRRRGWACQWRHKRNLPVNRDQMGGGMRYDWDAARKLYDEGACDKEIMRLLGCSQTAVYQWRAREGLVLHPAWERRAFLRQGKEGTDGRAEESPV